MQKSKSIAELYNEAKRFDCVLTVDAALARGLNRLVDTPRLGTFAITPLQLAAKYADIYFTKIYSKFEFVSLAAEEMKIPFRSAHAIIENILNIWNQTGLIENVEINLTDELKTAFKNLDTRTEVYEDKEFSYIFQKYPMLQYALQSFDESFFETENIAVIGKEFFNELDMQALPKNIFPEEISVFTNENFAFDKTYNFVNTKILIDNTVALITPQNENDIAIVLEPNSDYNILLQARLKEQRCEVLVNENANENLVVRFMLSLIENSFEYDSLKVRDMKEAGKFFGFEPEARLDNYNLESLIGINLADKNLRALFTIMKKVKDYTFESFTDELHKKFDTDSLDEFRKLISKINFGGLKISEENFIELKYILENFDINIAQRSQKKGVLFVDAKSSAFINRDVVLYLGLDETWSVTANEKLYIDKAKEDKNNLSKFEVLLQQGSERLYFTQEIKNNKEVLPAYYFSLFEKRPVVNFNDDYFNSVSISGRASVSNESVPEKNETLDLQEVKSIAPTPLKKFVECPAKYYYASMVPQKDAPHFKKGNLLHEFAEFYFQHPEFCRENYSIIMEYMLKQYSGVIPKSEIEIERTNFTIAIKNITAFLDENPVVKVQLPSEAEPVKNDMMFHFKKKLVYDFTEKKLSEDFILSGRSDLCDNKTIVDYKSGVNRFKKTDLPKLIDIDYIVKNEKDDFDFQVISYLAALNNEVPGKDLNFIYNYILSNRKNLLDARLKQEDNRTEFTYIDVNFHQYLQTENCYANIKESIKDDLKKYFEVFDFAGYKTIFEDVNLDVIDFFDKDSVVDSMTSEIMRCHKIMGFGYLHFNHKKEKVYIDNLRKIAVHFYNARNKYGYVFKDDVRKFTDYAKEKIYELNSYRKSNFPAKPIFESNLLCKGCDYLNICKGNLLWN